MIDVHSHILPNMDDGPKTVEESLLMLTESKRQGVEVMAATPHYYGRMPIEEFIAKRQDRYETLLKEAGDEIPEVVLGAEVAYSPTLLYEDGLSMLTYNGTNFLLLEMPFAKWPANILDDVRRIMSAHDIIPVIAHVERYQRYASREQLHELYKMDVVLQMNAENIIDPSSRRRALRMISSGKVALLGSDCHGIQRRVPNLGEAVDVMVQKKMHERVREIEAFSRAVCGLEV